MTTTNTLYVVSTSHLDWDWLARFEQYYGIGDPTSNPPSYAVRDILDQAISLIQTTPDYQYNLAEVAWLLRYLQDNPSLPSIVGTLTGRFVLLGGGITSPDNLLCHGEAFIRNYLVGRAAVSAVGLGALLTSVCWIPDDFGHDPQLPVALNAMGMTGVSFWRVPGNEPPPPASYAPTDGSDSLSAQLAANGVTFFWQAADGSTILAQQMSSTYGVVWDQSTPPCGQPQTPTSEAATLVQFVNKAAVQPGKLYMAPCGGDFSLPSSMLAGAVGAFNGLGTGVNAVMGTFQDFITAMNGYASDNPGAVKTLITFDPSNYWTGQFASRVQLKINHQRAVNALMAAETLSTLLRSQANVAEAVLNELGVAIGAAWNNLLPSTHHDYISGTAPDDTYWLEQLPLGQLALAQSRAALVEAMQRLGEAVAAKPQAGETPYVVFNPSGFNRTVGTLVEVRASHPFHSVSVRLPGQSTGAPAQILKSGACIFPIENLGSTGYGCVYLTRERAPAMAPIELPLADSYTISNNVVQITITSASGWAISSLVDVLNNNTELLAPNTFGNQITVYYERPVNESTGTSVGNLYQMGNELYPKPVNTGDGFFTDGTGSFVGVSGRVIENGPYRWHFEGTIHNADNSLTLTVEYFLQYNEPLVRVRVTGCAGSVASSVVTCWNVTDSSGNEPAGMNYGTGNHWNGPTVTPYWAGPTFRPTHDYLTLLEQGNEDGNPIAAVYHLGMRSWALAGSQLLGILFRNAPGIDRGAAGTDTAVHTQNYAYRITGVGNAASCQPLQESLAVQQRQRVAPVVTTAPVLNTLEETGMLAAMQESNAIIRVARTQEGSGGTPTDTTLNGGPLPFSFVLRIYQPTNSTAGTWHVNAPFLTTKGTDPSVSLVTALEAESDAAPPTYADGVITIASMPTLATVRVQTVGTYVAPNDGKSL